MSATQTETKTETFVRAPLNFWKERKDGKQIVVMPWTSGQMEFNRQEINVHDVRGHEAKFTLDKNGFQFIDAPTTFTKWDDDQAIWNEYFPSIEDIIKKTSGATRVHFFRYRLRDSSLTQNTGNQEGAAEFPHVDLALHAAPLIVPTMPEQQRPADWETLKEGRWGMFSFWRPIATVTRDALCVCDYTTVAKDDLKPYELYFEKPPGQPKTEGALIKHNPEHMWWYKSEMRKDEVVIIKNFDTKVDGRARCAPHGSFKSAGDYGESRKSIESRCLVFWEGESRD